MRLTLVLACTAALLSGQGRATTSGPLALHPDNSHYFLWRTKPAVLITSGEHYGALLNLDFDYRKYIDTLAADGMMLTRVFSGAYVEPEGAFNIARNTLAPLPGRFISPWARRTSRVTRTAGIASTSHGGTRHTSTASRTWLRTRGRRAS